MKHLTVRNVSDKLGRELVKEQRRRGMSLNQTVLELLNRALGLQSEVKYDNGLRRLAGTWSEKEFTEFEKNTAIFERIDQEVWS